MDVLSIKTDTLYFDAEYVPHMRDLCLLSILDGKIAHFPEALQGMRAVIVRGYFKTHLSTDTFVNKLQIDMHSMDCCLTIILLK